MNTDWQTGAAWQLQQAEKRLAYAEESLRRIRTVRRRDCWIPWRWPRVFRVLREAEQRQKYLREWQRNTGVWH